MNELTIEEERQVMDVVISWRRTAVGSDDAMKEIHKIFVNRKSNDHKPK